MFCIRNKSHTPPTKQVWKYFCLGKLIWGEEGLDVLPQKESRGFLSVSYIQLHIIDASQIILSLLSREHDIAFNNIRHPPRVFNDESRLKATSKHTRTCYGYTLDIFCCQLSFPIILVSMTLTLVCLTRHSVGFVRRSVFSMFRGFGREYDSSFTLQFTFP